MTSGKIILTMGQSAVLRWKELPEQQQLGFGILVRLFEKHRSPMAAILKDQIYEDEKYTTTALWKNLATNTEVHGNDQAKIYYNCNRVQLGDVPNSTLI